jgi:Tfp pilus assembly protein PilE
MVERNRVSFLIIAILTVAVAALSYQLYVLQRQSREAESVLVRQTIDLATIERLIKSGSFA